MPSIVCFPSNKPGFDSNTIKCFFNFYLFIMLLNERAFNLNSHELIFFSLLSFFFFFRASNEAEDLNI